MEQSLARCYNLYLKPPTNMTSLLWRQYITKRIETTIFNRLTPHPNRHNSHAVTRAKPLYSVYSTIHAIQGGRQAQNPIKQPYRHRHPPITQQNSTGESFTCGSFSFCESFKLSHTRVYESFSYTRVRKFF